MARKRGRFRAKNRAPLQGRGAPSSKSLAQTSKSRVYKLSSSLRRGLPEARISFICGPSLHLPVEPKPPSPRAVPLRAPAGTKAAVYTGAMHSWATRSPGWMV